MTRSYLPFIAFLILLLLTIPISFDFVTSGVPGLHTTIFTAEYIWGIIILIVLLIVTIGYWLLSKQTEKINWTLFAIHFVLTVTTIIYMKFPSILMDVRFPEQDKLIQALELRIKLIPIALALFIIGQLIFLVYYVRTVKSNRTLT